MSKRESKPRAKATRKQGAHHSNGMMTAHQSNTKHAASPPRQTGKERKAKLTERLLNSEDAFDSNDERAFLDW